MPSIVLQPSPNREDDVEQQMPDVREANLEIVIVRPTITVAFDSGLKRKLDDVTYKVGAAEKSDDYPTVGVPVMTNPKAIKKGTKLLCALDAELERICEKENSEKEKVAAAAAAAAVAEAAKKKSKKG